MGVGGEERQKGQAEGEVPHHHCRTKMQVLIEGEEKGEPVLRRE